MRTNENMNQSEMRLRDVFDGKRLSFLLQLRLLFVVASVVCHRNVVGLLEVVAVQHADIPPRCRWSARGSRGAGPIHTTAM